MRVDCHFHIFSKNAANPAVSRYPVHKSAPLADWLSLSESQGITHGVIVQPSFLGIDNDLLLNTIQQFPDRFRGVGVVEPTITKTGLADLHRQGMRGIRLNLSENPNPLEALDNNQILFDCLKELGMHVQIHHDDGLLNTLLLKIPVGLMIVVDHFGRPKNNSEFDQEQDGIDRHQENLWIKLSAPYRTPHIDHHTIYQYWLNKIGPLRLLWGSDWPHTRFDSNQNFASQIQGFQTLCQDRELQEQILSANPKSLYWT